MPSSINRHAERSEASPLQSKGAKVPLSNLPHKGFKAFWGSLEGNPLTPSIELETPHCVRGDDMGSLGGVSRREKSPPPLF
jgi:hypothetical protein